MVEEIGCRAIGLQVLGPYGAVTTDNMSVHRRTLTPAEVEAWLGVKLVEDVEIKGRFASVHGAVPQVCVGGRRPLWGGVIRLGTHCD